MACHRIGQHFRFAIGQPVMCWYNKEGWVIDHDYKDATGDHPGCNSVIVKLKHSGQICFTQSQDPYCHPRTLDCTADQPSKDQISKWVIELNQQIEEAHQPEPCDDTFDLPERRSDYSVIRRPDCLEVE
jgi:hypothetical protein